MRDAKRVHAHLGAHPGGFNDLPIGQHAVAVVVIAVGSKLPGTGKKFRARISAGFGGAGDGCAESSPIKRGDERGDAGVPAGNVDFRNGKRPWQYQGSTQKKAGK
jgi:hypothetical protein